MEQYIAENLVGQEVEFLCLGGGTFAGRVQGVAMGVVTIEWEAKETFIACDKIVAAWPRSEDARYLTSIGFAGR